MSEDTLQTTVAPAQPAAPAGMFVVENINLELFERAVYSRDYEKAGTLLLQNLRRLKAGGEFIGYPQHPRLRVILYTRFAAAVVALLVDEKFFLSPEGFDLVASEHAIMDLLFRASVFESSDHMLPQMAKNPEETDRAKLQLTNGPQIAKFLLTYSMRSSFAMNFDKTFTHAAQEFFALWGGINSALLTVAKQAHERREHVLGLHKLFADVDISDGAMPTLSDAYMYTSYATRADKHDAKATIHRMFARMLRKRGVAEPTREAIEQRRRLRANSLKYGKPVLFVGIEWFTSLHAMYRCYAPVIRQMREHFYVVAMSRPSDIDDAGKAEFDEWYPVAQDNINFADVVAKVNEIAPDVIYYPSLGMALWWVALASMRFAPVQVMSLGHPASSRSPCMDYVLCDEGAVGNADLFSEKIITYPNLAARFVMRPDAVIPEPLKVDDPETVEVAVPAMLCKLNAPFLATLREIAEASAKPVRFHFFINMMGLNLHQAAREIRDYLPTAMIYERAHVNVYLERLRSCHLHFSTFPFGGTNSNIDSMLLGLPVLTLEGDEPHERFDAIMLRAAGMDEGLIAQSREEYVGQAVTLIDQSGIRNAYRDQLLATDLKSIFYGEPLESERNAIGDAMDTIYRTHEDLQVSSEKIFNAREWDSYLHDIPCEDEEPLV